MSIATKNENLRRAMAFYKKWPSGKLNATAVYKRAGAIYVRFSNNRWSCTNPWWTGANYALGAWDNGREAELCQALVKLGLLEPRDMMHHLETAGLARKARRQRSDMDELQRLAAKLGYRLMPADEWPPPPPPPWTKTD